MSDNYNDLIKRLMIQDASFLTAHEKSLLQNNLDSFNRLAVMSNSELSSIIQRDVTRSLWNGSEVLKKAQTAVRLIKALGIKWTFIDSPDFPPMLREMKDPPYALFYRGNLDCLNQKCVSIVGTRRVTCTGRNAAFDFAKDASDDNVTVVSGLAMGVDICSHKGALAGKSGKTAAVLPGGIDTIVPLSNTKTASKIIEKGGVLLSEYTPGTPAEKFRFVQRNRIIAALSPATVVIQAPAGSGSMITAGLALDYNRYVFFHQVCFNSEAQMMDAYNTKDLELKALQGKGSERIVRNKLLNSPKRFVEDGAPVIKDYADFVEQFNSESVKPLKRENDGQMELFDI